MTCLDSHRDSRRSHKKQVSPIGDVTAGAPIRASDRKDPATSNDRGLNTMRFIHTLALAAFCLTGLPLAAPAQGGSEGGLPEDCTGKQKPKQVFFNDCMRSKDEAVAFYMDRYGDLYPPAAVPLDVFHFINVRNGPRPYVSPGTPEFASLKSLYAWKAGRAPGTDADWPNLLTHAGVAASGDFEVDWAAVQAVLRGREARRISALGREYDDVVLLIHGYNNDHADALAWYGNVESNFRSEGTRFGRRVAFVRMYWDGLKGKTPLFIWDNAQYNGYLVGLELRRLLAEVAGDTPLRVFTHSSGAYVITNALGDASAGAQMGKMPETYPDHSAGTAPGYVPPIQLRDLRVAMLVPAQPMNAFQYYLRNASSCPNGPGKCALVPQRLILGLSKRDFATNKAGVVPCHKKGATCMAVDIKQSCIQVANDLQIAPPRLLAVNFAKQGLWHPHAVDKYMEDDEWPELTRALLAPDQGMPTATPELCATPVGGGS